MDNVSLEIMVAALAKQLPGTFITKVHQMTPYHLLLRLRGGGQSGEKRLLISIAPQEPGLHLTSRRYLNPPRPLRFCAYLRHHFQGAKIRTVEKFDHDRIVIIRAARRDEEEHQLIIELIGKRGNAILSRGDDKLIGALMQEKTGAKRLQPGLAYQPPETDKYTDDPSHSSILLEKISRDDFRSKPSEELQADYDNWFFPHYQAHYGNLESRRLSRSLKQHQRRLKKRVKKLLAEQKEKVEHLNDSRYGDLLKGEIHNLKRGSKKVVVTDYYSTTLEKVEISLNPALSPLANLEKFYKNAKKAKRGIKLIAERLMATEQEENYSKELLFQLEQLSEDPDRVISDEEQELLELAAKLTEKKRHRQPNPTLVGKQKTGHKPNQKPKSKSDNHNKHRGVERAPGVSGGIIYLGRNVIGNENIYRHLSAPDDLWFHAHNQPGAHVLLKTAPGAKDCAKEQLQAATMAAAHSKAQPEKFAEVTMIRVKYLRKPKGGRLGQLLLSGPIQILRVKNYD
ncbi:NFACT family protein [bacterium]|nr:NFACT family protein [bacterium]